MMNQSKEKADILGSQISVWNLNETVQKLIAMTQDGLKHYVCVSNVHTVVMGSRDAQYAQVTNKATLATADGVPLVWASRVLGDTRIHGRASGPDILRVILEHPQAKDIKHFFYGSTPSVLASLKKELEDKYPHNKFAGFFSPPMRPVVGADAPLTNDERQDCQIIDQANPDIVWVGLGAPKQEIWMYRARPHMKAPVLIGVGAAFDFFSGNKTRAPRWMRENGLEWLFRLAQEPRRLTSRYLGTNPAFVAAVLKQAVLKDKNQ